MKFYNKYFFLNFLINFKGVEGIKKRTLHIFSSLQPLTGEDLWELGRGGEIWQRIKNDNKSVFIHPVLEYHLFGICFYTIFISFKYHRPLISPVIVCIKDLVVYLFKPL